MASKGKSQVVKGAKFLDERDPAWATKINLKKLDINSNLHCVLGQLGKKAGFKGTSPAFAFAVSLEIDPDLATALGFESFGEDGTAQTGLWKDEIQKRLPAPAVVTAATKKLTNKAKNGKTAKSVK